MKALIVGAGQDSSYLAEFLIEKGYKVLVLRRRSSSPSLWRFEKVIDNPNFSFTEGDITDYSSILNILSTYKPNEIYNLAAQSNVGVSFNQPNYTWKVCAEGVINLLECIKFLKLDTKLYQASSSEMFGKAYDWSVDKENGFDYLCWNTNTKGLCGDPTGGIKVQNEYTKFKPQSPYAIAKLAAHNAIGLYRDAFNIFCVGGILFNHESARRGPGFVTRKITKWFKDFISWKNDIENPYREKLTLDYKFPNGNIVTYRDKGWLFGPQYTKLKLGNIESFRDWGYAKEYVEAMWLMLQQDTPKDYVIGTGETHSVRDFLQEVMNYYNINVKLDDFINIDDNCKRPAEVPYLRADASLAEKELGWKPKVKFKELVQIMCENENGKE